MIVKPPSNKYEKQIYKIITENEEYQGLSEGEKSIIYDFAIQYIPKYLHIHWETMHIDSYVEVIKDCYKKHPSLTILQCVSSMINKFGYKTKVEYGEIVFLD